MRRKKVDIETQESKRARANISEKLDIEKIAQEIF